MKGSNNLYRCFIDLSFRLMRDNGSAALIHQDGHLTDPKARGFRRNWYRRIVKQFSFVNEITSKNFAEIAPYTRFSLNIYRGSEISVNFDVMSNLYLWSQVDDAYRGDREAEIPPLRDAEGKIVTSGDFRRIVRINIDAMRSICKLTEAGGSDPEEARFLQPYSVGMLEVFRQLESCRSINEASSVYTEVGADGSLSKLPGWQLSGVWTETGAQNDGTIKRETGFKKNTEDQIISGPAFYVGNPFYKTPNRVCRQKEDYEPIHLKSIPTDYRARTNFAPNLSYPEYRKRLPNCRWDRTKKHTDFYRLAVRRRISLGTERSLISAIIPPGVAHIHGVASAAFMSEMDLLKASAFSFSIIADFQMKVSGVSDFHQQVLGSFPMPDFDSAALSRVLSLTCLTEDYADLWNRNAPVLNSGGLRSALSDCWSPTVAIRDEISRRTALVEIDVLTAIALGMSLDQLIDVYRIYFPVLQRKERKTYYDRDGEIAYVSAKGLEKVGYLNDVQKSISLKEWNAIVEKSPRELTCTAIDDTMPGGPRTVTRHFVGPFTQRDRIEDYRRTWAHFEWLKSEEAV